MRARSVALCETLAPEDFVVQSMPDVSPTKWHLAHVSWFFERFVLSEHVAGYRAFDDTFDFLFNSYYFTAGQMHERPRRGLLSRPTVREVFAYREHVDAAMMALLEERGGDAVIQSLVELGLNHEQQHQELLLTDIKHVFATHPFQPPVNSSLPVPPVRAAPELVFRSYPGGVVQIGADAGGAFAFDNETPRHEVLLRPFKLASRLVTNDDFRQFIDDGGYASSELWLSDGWACVQAQDWKRPWYWREDLASEYTLGGLRDINPAAPAAHLSYYEADAFARWAGARLPSEAEWETAASACAVEGNLLNAGWWTPAPGCVDEGAGPQQLFGDVWEWTSTPYSAYPGFRPLGGSLGEYNGKFMCNQMVVRGGSCVTADDHIRPTYRSFFYPDARWQFLGLRLAQDA